MNGPTAASGATLRAVRDEDLGELTDDAIAGAWRVWQRARGHRYSVDDVATAWEALHARPDARRAADIGCGLGSVAIMLAYKLPGATLAAIEAQEISHALAERNLARNGLAERVALHHGDLRGEDLAARLGAPFDLVTGTPPYFDPKKSSPSTDAQRTYARIEMRGGIEAYLAAGAKLLAPGGRLVVCGDAKRPDRASRGAEEAGLRVLTRRDLVPREGKGALFSIWTFAREQDEPDARELELPPIVARTEGGARTQAAHDLRRFFDLPVDESEPASPPIHPRHARRAPALSEAS